MQLIIAEKPSMAGEIAKVLGANHRSNGFWSGNGIIVSNAVGHLIELAAPADYRPEWKQWKVENLPMIPQPFKFRVVERTASQYGILRDLFNKSEVVSIINACDAGREGELIFWRIYEQIGSRKPVQRLWISSLTTESIKAGFQNLRPASEYDGFRQAAKIRQEADWIVGLNATQAQTLVARAGGAGDTYSLGRVQTPTLVLVVKRDLEIENFKAVDYFELEASFKIESSREILGMKLFDAEKKQFKRFLNKQEANSILAFLQAAAPIPVTIENLVKNQKSIAPPQLFDLTTLQRTANNRFGFSAAKTLELMQTLYEAKYLTYPRTSSRYLTSDLSRTLPGVIKALPDDFRDLVRSIPDVHKPLPKRFVDDQKVTDHHAIIPTDQAPQLAGLSSDEAAIYNLVTRRFIGMFLPNAVDEVVEITVIHGNQTFFARGISQISAGWRLAEKEISGETVDDKENETEENRSLPVLHRNDNLSRHALQLLAKKTKPPARFSEASLLGAMETAGKTIEDEELRNAMKDTGLGTPATRANIIEKLIRSNYLVREKKTLRSTLPAREIIRRLAECKSILASPELTGQWEQALAKIERREFSAETMREAVINLTKEIVAEIFTQKSNSTESSFAEAEQQIPCPNCSANKRRGYLKQMKKDGRAFAFCTTGKEVCGYITTTPTTKKFLEKMLGSTCPKCRSAMQFRLSKTKTPFLTCYNRENCDGVIWLESKKR